MDDRLPSDVDVVVLGTGLPEAIIAAACSRSGLTVLHLDRNDYYGETWSSFNMNTMEEWLESNNTAELEKSTTEEISAHLKDGEVYTEFGDRQVISNVESVWTSEALASDEENKSEKEKLKDISRRFSIDLLPKALLSRGEMVKTLCDSQVSNYTEFKLIDRQLCPAVDEPSGEIAFNQVPCSKGDIFTSQVLTMLEKRMLMKFINFCTQYSTGSEEAKKLYIEYESKPFSVFLETMGIKGHLQSYIIDAIAILQPRPLTSTGLDAVCKFMDSVGHFGPSPFLFPLYGCGELAQCFCRLSAVFGSTYCLARPVNGLISADGSVKAVIADGQRINCSTVFMSPRYLPSSASVAEEQQDIRRVTYLTKSSLKTEEKQRITLSNLATLRPSAEVTRIIEAGSEACLTPKGYYLLHATGSSDGDETLDKAVESLMEKKEVKHLWKLSFDMTPIRSRPDEPVLSSTSQVYLCPTIDANLDYARVVNQCKSLFCSIWPDRDFLPRGIAKSDEDEEDNHVEHVESQKINASQETYLPL